MAWIAPIALTLVLLGLLFGGLVSRRLNVGPSGDWVMGWWMLLLSYLNVEIPGHSVISDGFAGFLAPLFPLMMLSGAFRYANRDVPKSLPSVSLLLCGVAGASIVAGISIRAELIALFVSPLICFAAALVVIPAANTHRTLLQQLTAPGLALIGVVLAFDAYGEIFNSNEWNSLLLWLVTGLPIATLQISGAFELVGDRLTKTSAERDQNATALAGTISKLRDAHAQLETRVIERTAQLREEIRERQKIEESLATSEQHYRKVTSLLTDFSFAGNIGADGTIRTQWLTGTILPSHPPANKTTEPAEPFDPRPLIHPDDRPELMRRLDVALTGEVADFQTRINIHGESERWVGGRMIGERVGQTGELILYATGRDITANRIAEIENKNLRERAREGQRLESLGALARGVAHDFNNLLSVVLGNAAILSEDLPRDSIMKERAERIRKSARYAAEIATQILTYSGDASVSPEPLDLARLVSEMSELLEAGTRNQFQLELRLDRELPQIMGDAAQLRQVVLNLITNATEAMGEAGGRVELRTGVVTLDLRAISELHHTTELLVGDHVYLDVVDEGPGMDAETQARVFDPFFSTKLTGRGLGLAVAHGILRAHNAAITVASCPGVGTRFRVLFPILSTAADCAQPSAPLETLRIVPSPPPDKPATILVIDDDESVSELAETVLERVGFEVMLAAGGKEGLEILEKNAKRIALVILDLSMPDISGEVVLQRIRQLFPELPVVISSGYSEPVTGARVRSTPHVDFVGKPYEPDILVERVRTLLSAR